MGRVSILTQMREACRDLDDILARAQLEDAPDEVVSRMGFTFRAARTYLGACQKVTEDLASSSEADRKASGSKLTEEQWEMDLPIYLDHTLECLRLVREWDDEWRQTAVRCFPLTDALTGEPAMWDRFTERAREAVWQAQKEAIALDAGAVGPEHLLLGLLRNPGSVACRALGQMGVDLEGVRSRVLAEANLYGPAPPGRLRVTPRFEHALKGAYRAADQLNTNYIGTEHLLLGMLKAEGSLAEWALRKAGMEYAATLDCIERLLSSGEQAPPGSD